MGLAATVLIGLFWFFDAGGNVVSARDRTRSELVAAAPAQTFGNYPTTADGLNNIISIFTLDPTDLTLRIWKEHAANSGGALPMIGTPICGGAPSGMVAWYPGEGNASDVQGPTFENGTLVNGATFTAGKVEQAFSFDGTNDYVAVPHAAILNIPGDLTIEGWINPQVTAGFHGIVSKRSLDNLLAEYLLSVSNGKLSFASRNGGGFVESFSTATIPTNTFTHVAATIVGTTLRLYINGALDSTHSTVARPVTTGRLTFGAAEVTSCGACDFWQGVIDEVSIYDRGTVRYRDRRH